MSYGHLSTTIVLVLLVSCSHIGPKTVTRDRFDYNTAIADSWKEQTLLNIVKLRYADMPLFVEVASVVSGYTLEGSVDLGGTVSSKSAVQGDFFHWVRQANSPIGPQLRTLPLPAPNSTKVL